MSQNAKIQINPNNLHLLIFSMPHFFVSLQPDVALKNEHLYQPNIECLLCVDSLKTENSVLIERLPILRLLLRICSLLKVKYVIKISNYFILFLPMQFLGPPLNGRYANGWILAKFSGSKRSGLNSPTSSPQCSAL